MKVIQQLKNRSWKLSNFIGKWKQDLTLRKRQKKEVKDKIQVNRTRNVVPNEENDTDSSKT
jgi:hypothetical protein